MLTPEEQKALSQIQRYMEAGHALDRIRDAGWADWLAYFEAKGIDPAKDQPIQPPEQAPAPTYSPRESPTSTSSEGGEPIQAISPADTLGRYGPLALAVTGGLLAAVVVGAVTAFVLLGGESDGGTTNGPVSDLPGTSIESSSEKPDESSSEKPDADEAHLDPVIFFFYNLEFFDLEAMLEQVCPELRDETESALFLLQSLVVFAGESLLDLSDFSVETVSVEGDRAFVQVLARISGGSLGSTRYDEVLEVRKQGDGWCMTDTDFLDS
ncbi:MAG: hypothetical protein J4N95_00010 [Chloroflexi bacterium]|nr:hypothetical protein [Chloroflexota bacterium]MCI0855155.1 hypothetical protein [Chloroflexota bacterium]MCI0889441.1 hypothetical protein [Chloroflexota bacterium]